MMDQVKKNDIRIINQLNFIKIHYTHPKVNTRSQYNSDIEFNSNRNGEIGQRHE